MRQIFGRTKKQRKYLDSDVVLFAMDRANFTRKALQKKKNFFVHFFEIGPLCRTFEDAAPIAVFLVRHDEAKV
jgi:hypothetical protein